MLLSVRNLRTTFATEAGMVKAVNGISFDVRRGEVLSIVGESGSGKSVTSLSIMGLLEEPPAKIEADVMTWKGEDLLGASEERMRQIRGGEIAMIFQDPLSALNPVQTVGRQVAEMARIHDRVSKKDAWDRAVEMLGLVGIPQPERRAEMHPHEFSGGMRQRAVIAMAITCNPDLLIADEPTTALDVTVQAQVLDVLMEMKEEIDSSIVLITHDLGVVAGLADRVIVMYAGREAEVGTTHEVFYETRHPYTLGLLASMPRLDDTGVERAAADPRGAAVAAQPAVGLLRSTRAATSPVSAARRRCRCCAWSPALPTTRRATSPRSSASVDVAEFREEESRRRRGARRGASMVDWRRPPGRSSPRCTADVGARPRQELHRARRCAQPGDRQGPGLSRASRSTCIPARRRTGRRVGVRQVDDRTARAAADRADVGKVIVRGTEIGGLKGDDLIRVPPAAADRVPGPVRLAQPTEDDRAGGRRGVGVHAG